MQSQRTVFHAASHPVVEMNFAEHGTELHVPAGRRLLLAGPFPQALMLITAGRGRVRCAGETVAELSPGDVFGDLAPRRQAYETATVIAVSDLTLIAFSSRQVKLMGQLEPEAVATLLGTGRAPMPAAAAATKLALVPMAPERHRPVAAA